MFDNRLIPPAFSLIRKGNVFLLLRNDYKDLLLEQGIEDPKAFLQKHRQMSTYLRGRTLHPSIPLREEKRIVIRRYLHGGLLGAFTRDFYLFGSRSFRELVLTVKMRTCGIPTIEPIGAIHQTLGPFHQAYLLSLEIPEAKDLVQYLQEIRAHPSRERLLQKRRIFHSAGLLVRQLHQAGFFHGDLQLKNILVSGEELFLIDLDHSYQRDRLTTEEKKRNLLRLNRSVEKWKKLGLPITWTDRLRFFRSYAEEDEEIKRAMKKAWRAYPLRHLFYRWSWAVQKILKK
ncbi:MAG: lipopolysaccharide kinase InaA family protein [Thermodesulfobacteriota bacterium]